MDDYTFYILEPTIFREINVENVGRNIFMKFENKS